MRPAHNNSEPSDFGLWTLDFGLRCLDFRLWPLAAALLLATTSSLPAQPPAPSPRDPLMSLMTSQPQIAIAATPVATATFDPPVVGPGEQAFYRVVFNALEESIEWPAKLPAPPQLEIRPGAHGQILQMTGVSLEPRTAFNYRVRAASLGVFTVPEFVVKVYGKPVTVPAAQLEVVAAPPAAVRPAPRLMLDLPATNLFVGQPVTVRMLLPGSPRGAVQGLGQPQLSGQGFLVDLGAARQRIEMLALGGANLITFVYETTLTPVMTGKLSVFAQGFTAGNHFSGTVVITGLATIPGAPPQYTLLESDPVELNVRPLPTEGELPGFTGAIGSFAVGPPKLATNVLRIGDPVKLTVAVTNSGDGPLARLVAPPPPQAPEWQVFAAADFAPAQLMPVPTSPARPPTQPSGVQGVVFFNYTLIPLTETARATPPIPFSSFDPKTGRYADLTIPSVAVTVQAGATPADFMALTQSASTAGEPDKELVLHGLAASRGRIAASLVPPQQQAWFPLIQLAPAAAFFGLWNWDRRRRYLEQHPDVLLRRRARRALRHQWRILRRAAQAADAPRFAAAGVNALRVACAPHYPAEPRALVGADVLPLLPEPDRSGRAGEVVHRFFEVTDATQFSTSSPNPADLLLLQPDIERVLQQLEDRL